MSTNININNDDDGENDNGISGADDVGLVNKVSKITIQNESELKNNFNKRVKNNHQGIRKGMKVK